MRHKQPSIVNSKTFKLIQELQALPQLQEFFLVGGTSLALQLGHGNSIDIDLFCLADFNPDEIAVLIKPLYQIEEIYKRHNSVIFLINNIKTHFIKHDYPLVNPPITEGGITFLGKEDIAAMKLHAIIQSGQRLKDFIHIYFLLEYFSMSQMIAFFEKKYAYGNPMIALNAVNFDKVDERADPPKLLKPISLAQIKKRIQSATKNADKIFSE